MATSYQQPIETFHIALRDYVSQTIEDRVARLMVVLIQLIRQSYEQKFKVVDAGGASSTLDFQVTRTALFIEAVIGSSKANSYLQNLEYGEKGTRGGVGFYTRTKAPPIKNIYEWVKRAALVVPGKLVKMADANQAIKDKGGKLDEKRPWYSETDPIKMYAFWIAIHIKQFGRPALHIIEHVLTQQQARIEQALAQDT